MKPFFFQNDFETQNFDIFDKVVHNYGKPDKVASSDFGLSGHGPMAFLAPTFWTASCFGLSVLGLRLFGLWSV